jgi:hypothetical protein
MCGFGRQTQRRAVGMSSFPAFINDMNDGKGAMVNSLVLGLGINQ